jgi:LysR family transcriptional regulator, glycine cleavage system transcriptional activator
MATRSNTPLVALRCFEAASRRLSFQAAAEELCVTPTAVSHQIRRLERRLGLKLFLRLNRQVVLTEVGRELADRLHEAFGLIDSALEIAVKPRRSPIQVSAMPSLAAKWLAPRLHRFEARHPKWSVRLSASDRLVNFDRENIDVGVRYGAGRYRGLYVEELMVVDVFPVCSPLLLRAGHAPLRKPSDLRYHTLLHDETSMAATGIPNWRTWLKAGGASKVKPDRGPVFGGVHLALEAAIAGHGVALGLSPLVADDLARGRLIRPLAFEMRSSFSFWIVCAKDRAQDARIRAFRGWLALEAKRISDPPASLAGA